MISLNLNTISKVQNLLRKFLSIEFGFSIALYTLSTLENPFIHPVCFKQLFKTVSGRPGVSVMDEVCE